jgi:thymidylate synthase
MDLEDDRKGSIWYDQISRLVNLLRIEPDSRRMIVNAWNVAELDEMVLPPCHYGFQVYTRELSYSERYRLWFNKNYETGMEYDENVVPDFDNDYYDKTPKRAISLMWNQRSVDTFLGLPFNIASYGLLLMLLGKLANMVPDNLIGNLGDVHLYLNHIEQAQEQKTRTSFPLPKVELNFDYVFRDGYMVAWDRIKIDDIILKNYVSHPSIKAPLSN